MPGGVSFVKCSRAPLSEMCLHICNRRPSRVVDSSSLMMSKPRAKVVSARKRVPLGAGHAADLNGSDLHAELDGSAAAAAADAPGLFGRIFGKNGVNSGSSDGGSSSGAGDSNPKLSAPQGSQQMGEIHSPNSRDDKRRPVASDAAVNSSPKFHAPQAFVAAPALGDAIENADALSPRAVIEVRPGAAKEAAENSPPPDVDWDKLVVHQNWFLDMFHSLRNDTSLICSVASMSPAHPFTRRMRIFKTINVVLLNLVFAALIAAYVSLRCPDCSSTSCNTCVTSSPLCNYCVDGSIGACFTAATPEAYFASGSCLNFVVTESSCASATPASTKSAPSGARDACKKSLRGTSTVIGYGIGLGLVSAVYCVFIEVILSCSCCTRLCDRRSANGERCQSCTLRLVSATGILVGLLSIAFLGLAIAVANQYGNNVGSLLYSWMISIIASEIQGWIISLVYFIYAYNKEKSNQLLNDQGEISDGASRSNRRVSTVLRDYEKEFA